MVKEEVLELTLNAEELLQELAIVEAEAEKVEETVEDVKNESKITFQQVMGMAHAGWLTVHGLVRAAGGSIQTVFRTIVGTTLGAISILYPLLQATTVTPGMQVQGVMGLISISLAIQALIAAQAKEKEFSDALRGANMAMHGMQSMIGMMNF